MKNVFNSLLNLFFPSLCVVCSDRLIDEEQHICIGCLSQLPRTYYHKQENNRLEHFFAARFPFQRIAAYAYFIHDGSIQKIIHELKYKNNAALGQYMGELYGADLKHSHFMGDIDLLVPVPLHPKRIKKRGYNQALEIAIGIAKHTCTPIDTNTLLRKVNNPSQTQNSRFDRWKNVENVFSLTHTDVFEGKHILLIDDVITTGSTLESCAKEILKSKDCRISVLAIGVAT